MSKIVEEVKAMKICANDKCMVAFQASRHNQIYCGEQCRREVTNSRIMLKYYEEVDRKSGKPRTCAECEVSRLSRYNEGNTCAPCVAKRAASARKNLLASLGIA